MRESIQQWVIRFRAIVSDGCPVVACSRMLRVGILNSQNPVVACTRMLRIGSLNDHSPVMACTRMLRTVNLWSLEHVTQVE